MSPNESTPTEAIARALFQLRGRRPRRGNAGDPDKEPRLQGHPDPHEHGHGHGHHHHDRHEPHGQNNGGPNNHGTGRRSGEMALTRMLFALASEEAPMSVSSLGESIGVDQPRASRLVQQAVERGMVQREADPEDARRTRIALTEAGTGFTQRVKSERQKSLERALTGFSDEERSELARLLSKLADNWQP